MEEAAEEERFLWEDISSSLDEVERQEVRRVVGDELISSCEDVYAEVRALREIYSECCADTDALLQEGERAGALVAPAGLLQLEVQQLVVHLRQQAAANGASDEEILRPISREQRLALDRVMDPAPRPRSRGEASVERLGLHEMRGSRPTTASFSEFAPSRPATGSVSSQAGGGRAGAAGWGPSRPSTSSWSRPTTAASASSRERADDRGARSMEVETLTVEPKSEAKPPLGAGVGGAVIRQLRAALDEERLALLAQTEQLHLSIEDECEYRSRTATPMPSSSELHSLKLALQKSIAQQEHAAHAPALRSGPLARERRPISRSGPPTDAQERPHSPPQPQPRRPVPSPPAGSPPSSPRPGVPPRPRGASRLRGIVADCAAEP